MRNLSKSTNKKAYKSSKLLKSIAAIKDNKNKVEASYNNILICNNSISSICKASSNIGTNYKTTTLISDTKDNSEISLYKRI